MGVRGGSFATQPSQWWRSSEAPAPSTTVQTLTHPRKCLLMFTYQYSFVHTSLRPPASPVWLGLGDALLKKAEVTTP